jgi:hypothetical protein
MTIADAYRRLGTVLSGLESQGIEVTAVTPDEAEGEEPLVVDLRITIPADADASEVPPPEEVGADGGPQVTSNAEANPSPGGAMSESDSGAATEEPVASAGPFPCTESGCPAAFDSEGALTVHRIAEHDRPQEPLHQHEPALGAAYEAYDSFSSMTEALGVDVTAQTVRRNMMKAGIHDPGTGDGSADTSESAPAESEPDAGDEPHAGDEPDPDGSDDEVQGADGSPTDEQPVTDGSGAVPASGSVGTSPEPSGESEGAAQPTSDPAAEPLPEGVTVEGLREAVVEGGSLRAVARRLDCPSGEARGLLDELGLLEQVHGRVATRPDRDQRAAAFDDWHEAQRSDSGGDEPGRVDD